MLMSKFESIRIQENKTLFAFHSKLSDIVNSYFNLGEKLLESKVMRKILRSLLKRFKLKVMTIKESKDIDFRKVDELITSL